MMAGMEECRAHRAQGGPNTEEGQGVHGAVGGALLSKQCRKFISSQVSVFLPLVRVGTPFILLWQDG